MVEVTSPGCLAIRLYVTPAGGFANAEFRRDRADLDNPSITNPLMRRADGAPARTDAPTKEIRCPKP
jgi:hypothetical protein